MSARSEPFIIFGSTNPVLRAAAAAAAADGEKCGVRWRSDMIKCAVAPLCEPVFVCLGARWQSH